MNEESMGASLRDRAVVNGAGQAVSALRASVPSANSFYVDCEFDGHGGDLISMAMVREDGLSLYVVVSDANVQDEWVCNNVIPILYHHDGERRETVPANEVGQLLRGFLSGQKSPEIIADSPVDIGRFCQAISTGSDGGWASTEFPQMRFRVENVDCYPTDLAGAIQHNAWWDAMALRKKLTAKAIEARRAETGTGSVEDESAVPAGHSPEPSIPSTTTKEVGE